MAKKILFQIEVENVGAARRIEALREEIRRLNKEIRGVETGSDAFNELIAKVTGAKQETARLKEEQKALNREFQAAKVPKDSLAGLRIEYAKLADQIKVLSAAERNSKFGQELVANAAKVKSSIDGIEQSIGRFTGNVGNYSSAFQGLQSVLLSIGAGFGFSEIIQQNTRLSDSIANVAKTTGLTIDEAEKLAEVLKFRDTRTSLADQLKITEIGGQLGIATDQLQGFTEGVDVLNVALGDQFGNVDNLTREFAGLRNVLTDFKTGDAADDILKLGNAVNYLEAQGNATGQSIVDFAGRIAGAGVPLGVTTAQIIGLSTTLSELSINPERGATAISRLLTEVARSPAVFAQAIGEPADKFTKLVQTDIVGALALVSERIATSSTTNTAFAQTLEELGIGAQGAIEVFGKLGGSTDLLRQRIAEAGQTLQNTDSITREFEVKNNNAAAAVEKLKNAIIAAFTGEGAQDAIAAIAEELTGLVNVLAEIPGFLAENKEEVLALAAAFIYLNRQGIVAAVPLLGRLVETFGLLTTAAGRATLATEANAVATRALAAAQAALPFLALVAGIYALVKAYESLTGAESAAAKNAEILADSQKAVNEEASKEIALSNQHFSVLKSETASREAKRAAIDALMRQYPEYLKGIDLEKQSVFELTQLQDGLNESILRSVAERQKAAATNKLFESAAQDVLRAQQLREGAAATTGESQLIRGQVGITEVFDRAGANEKIAKELEKRAAETQKQADDLAKSFDKAFKLKVDVEFALSPEQQDALDLKRQFDDNAKATKELGDAAAGAGDKIAGLGGKSKGAKAEAEAQAGSVAALKKELSDLEKQIENTSPDSPRFASLVKELDGLKAKLKEAEQAFASARFRARTGGRIGAPEVEAAEQPDIEFDAGLSPDSDEKLKNDAEAVRAATEAQLRAIGFDITVNPPTDEEIKRAQILFDIQREEGRKLAEEQKQQQQEREELQQLAVQSAIESTQTIANSLFEIQNNRLQQETQAAIDALDIETQSRIAAAKGNETKIAAIEKDAQKKRDAIEKEAARQRKNIAVKEALINTALAITKALTGAPPPANFILAGVAAAAGLAQLAVIRSQEFWQGGVVKSDGLLELSKIYIKEFYKGGAVVPDEETVEKMKHLYLREYAFGGAVKRLKPGTVNEPQNAPRTSYGDTVLAYLAPGEMVLNRPQQNTIRSLFGQDAFALAGVPGEAATRRGKVPGFASGGVVGIVPQNGFNQQPVQSVQVEATAGFSDKQVEDIGTSLGAIIAAEVSQQLRIGIGEGLLDANRRLEREAVSNEQRQG